MLGKRVFKFERLEIRSKFYIQIRLVFADSVTYYLKTSYIITVAISMYVATDISDLVILCVYSNLAISSKLNFSTYVAMWLHSK